MRAFILVSAVAVSACVGPEAPDVELCRDVIGRLCLQPYCAGAQSRLNLPDENCEAELRARTGCDTEDFTFSTPDRARVLDCRLPLVRDSANRSAPPRCDYVDETLRNCPDLVTFLGGAR
ncbi:MAG: hypothetical protein DI536_33935 [Archangium gephyra]|uniref:Lipoprotein n=1 Tax=Archangium gephyra TaxID=48 RepID=A0A2W5SSD9_9BACT|nr:MAG: hypothetical protein DI536_33935 [Archangium gephyra]